MTIRLLITFILVAMAASVGCAHKESYQKLEPITYVANDSESLWKEAKDAIQGGNYALAKLKLAQALGANPELGEDSEWKSDFEIVTKQQFGQEFILQGGE